MLKEFKEFAVTGNVVDMAVGIIIGAAFGKIVDSLVKDLIMPPIGLALGKVDFQNLFVVLKHGAAPGPYLTVEAAQKAGAVTLQLRAVHQHLPELRDRRFRRVPAGARHQPPEARRAGKGRRADPDSGGSRPPARDTRRLEKDVTIDGAGLFASLLPPPASPGEGASRAARAARPPAR